MDRAMLQALLSYCLLVGTGAGSILFFAAPLWGALWGTSDAIAATKFAAISVAIAPGVGLCAALLRRDGRFRGYSIALLIGNLSGMVVGALCVLIWPTSVTLLVSVTVAQGIVLIYGLAASWSLLGGLKSPFLAREEIGYSWRLMATNMVSFVNGNIVRFAVSRQLGISYLGQWNRAEMLTSIPFQQLQTALSQAVYPEFRHHRDRPAVARRAWTDMLAAVSWLVLPAGALLAALSPVLLGLLFGSGWGIAQQVAPILAVLGAVQLLGTLLGQAIESLGRFSWIWGYTIAMLAVLIVVAVATSRGLDFPLVIGGVLVAMTVRHGVQVMLATKGGFLEVKRLSAHYLGASGLALAVAAVVVGPSFGPVGWVASAGLLLALSVAAALTWRRFPPIAIGRRYGLFGS